jgi:hypothetical protein
MPNGVLGWSERLSVWTQQGCGGRIKGGTRLGVAVKMSDRSSGCWAPANPAAHSFPAPRSPRRPPRLMLPGRSYSGTTLAPTTFAVTLPEIVVQVATTSGANAPAPEPMGTCCVPRMWPSPLTLVTLRVMVKTSPSRE